RLEQRVERIEGESPAAQLDAERSAVREQSRRVDGMLGEVDKRLKELETSGKARAEPSARQGELAEELKRLRGMLEQQGQRLDAQGQRLDGMEKALAQARRSAGERVAEPRPVAPKAPSPREAPPMSQDKAGYLAFSREQELKGEKTVARELYEQYVKEFPSDPTTAEAHFRLGELAYGERRYNDAILSFGKVAAEFPRSARAPDALVRTAESMLQLNMKDEAVAVLSEVPQRYPGTSAAERAKKHLADLPGTSTAAKKRK
ncbi:MAG TPA: tol-pal system protein YbgF, partial [Anaeromyxobacter sp.]|nr:tol-pal system protein YbgF [Anaeromyxobacter sp.]